jgi:hypothetical protein
MLLRQLSLNDKKERDKNFYKPDFLQQIYLNVKNTNKHKWMR